VKFKAPKGTRDILPQEISKWQFVEKKYAELCRVFGYKEIRIPTFESTDVFKRGVGDTTDIVQKEMYTFDDKGNRSITLRPEGTAGVARAYVENGMASLPSPIRLYYNITAFRYENVQKGRFREFHQLGLEAFGSCGPKIDAEIIGLLDIFFRNLGIAKTGIRINSIGCPFCRSKYNELLKEYLSPNLDSLCKTCNDRFYKNPLRIIDCKEPDCKKITLGAPALADNLCEECYNHFEGLQSELKNLKIEFEIDKTIVRGLDYYTKTVFEFISENVGTQGTICGGGRYDGLIEQFGGLNTPGIGFALGIERLLMELDAQGITCEEDYQESIFLAFADKDGEILARKLCMDLRKSGIKADTELCERSLKAQMKYAGKNGYTYTCVIGESEIQNGKIKFKNMGNGEETEIDSFLVSKLTYDSQGGIIWQSK